jgi:hypothetical protein
MADALGRVAASLAAYGLAACAARALTASGVAPAVAYQLLVATVIADSRLLWMYFRRLAPETT